MSLLCLKLAISVKFLDPYQLASHNTATRSDGGKGKVRDSETEGERETGKRQTEGEHRHTRRSIIWLKLLKHRYTHYPHTSFSLIHTLTHTHTHARANTHVQVFSVEVRSTYFQADSEFCENSSWDKMFYLSTKVGRGQKDQVSHLRGGREKKRATLLDEIHMTGVMSLI